MTTLNKELDSFISGKETIEGLKKAFKSTLKGEIIDDDLTELELTQLEELEEGYKARNGNFREGDEEKQTRSFIKIRKGVCLVHTTDYLVDFLVENEIIKQIRTDQNISELRDLIGYNIKNIQKDFPQFKEIQEELIKGYKKSNI